MAAGLLLKSLGVGWGGEESLEAGWPGMPDPGHQDTGDGIATESERAIWKAFPGREDGAQREQRKLSPWPVSGPQALGSAPQHMVPRSLG